MPDSPSRLPRRLRRLASRMRMIVSQVIQRELDDPRLGFVTVLRVEPTEDLKEAKIYVSVLGPSGARSKAAHALESARGLIQRELGKNLETRSTPILRFVVDDSQERVSQIEALIDEANREDQEEP